MHAAVRRLVVGGLVLSLGTACSGSVDDPVSAASEAARIFDTPVEGAESSLVDWIALRWHIEGLGGSNADIIDYLDSEGRSDERTLRLPTGDSAEISEFAQWFDNSFLGAEAAESTELVQRSRVMAAETRAGADALVGYCAESPDWCTTDIEASDPMEAYEAVARRVQRVDFHSSAPVDWFLMDELLRTLPRDDERLAYLESEGRLSADGGLDYPTDGESIVEFSDYAGWFDVTFFGGIGDLGNDELVAGDLDGDAEVDDFERSMFALNEEVGGVGQSSLIVAAQIVDACERDKSLCEFFLNQPAE
jgi:hypothetical protein